jgi:hypothetical protein
MLNIENFGIKSLEEIRQFLSEHDLGFGMQLEEGDDGELFVVGEPNGEDAGVVAEEEK